MRVLTVASSSTKAPEQLVRRRLRQSGSIISSSSAFSTSGESFSWSKVISRLASCRSTRAPISSERFTPMTASWSK